MLASAKGADKHVAHNAWVRHGDGVVSVVVDQVEMVEMGGVWMVGVG